MSAWAHRLDLAEGDDEDIPCGHCKGPHWFRPRAAFIARFSFDNHDPATGQSSTATGTFRGLCVHHARGFAERYGLTERFRSLLLDEAI